MALPLVLALRFSRVGLREASATAHAWALAYVALGAATVVVESGWALTAGARRARRRSRAQRGGGGSGGGDDDGDDDDNDDDEEVPLAVVAEKDSRGEQHESAARRQRRRREDGEREVPEPAVRAEPPSEAGSLSSVGREVWAAALGPALGTPGGPGLGRGARRAPSLLFRAVSPVCALAVFGYTSRRDAPAGAPTDALVLVACAAALTTGLLPSPYPAVEDAKRWYARSASFAQQSGAWVVLAAAGLLPRIARAADAALGTRVVGLVAGAGPAAGTR